MKRVVKFHDKENKVVKAECEITTRNGYPEFTMSFERDGGMGQTGFVPKEGCQEDLYNLWKKWHLNGMNAGTEKQANIIKKWLESGEKYDYHEALSVLAYHNRTGELSNISYKQEMALIDKYKEEIKVLNEWNEAQGEEKNGEYYTETLAEYEKILSESEAKLRNTFVYDIHPVTGKEYKYGTEWIRKDLPEDFEDTLNEICDNVEEEEDARFEDGVDSWDDIYDENGELLECLPNLEDEKIIALGKHLEITPTEANEDIEQSGYDDCVYSYGGTDYLVCTDEEADEKWDEDLDNYIEECVLPEIPEHLRNYFDEESWKVDARNDGRGHSLNRYNGCEDEERVGDTGGNLYYIYRQ